MIYLGVRDIGENLYSSSRIQGHAAGPETTGNNLHIKFGIKGVEGSM